MSTAGAWVNRKTGERFVCVDEEFVQCSCSLCRERDREQPELRKLVGVTLGGQRYRVRVPQ